MIMNDGIIVNPFKTKNACVEISVDAESKDSPTKKTDDIDRNTLDLPKRKIVTWALHQGYTKESILGSIYKCNPQIKGPDIEITDNLQKCNEIYDTSCIITNIVYQYLPEQIAVNFRKIDRVIMSKDNNIYTLYSIDWFPENQTSFETDDLSSTEQKKKKQMVIAMFIKEQIDNGEKSSLFSDEMDIQMSLATDHEFKFAFRSAIDYYIVGAWDDSLQLLRRCLNLRPRDGPTLEIFRFINEEGSHGLEGKLMPPKDWKGHRNIMEQVAEIVE